MDPSPMSFLEVGLLLKLLAMIEIIIRTELVSDSVDH